jgi:hypothetical protein
VDLVFDFAEDVADFVFDGVRAADALLEAVDLGEVLAVFKHRLDDTKS